ncbi:MAG TPA: disulfide bond formation protein B [Magnetospirillaceae bacterium]|jgi:disulfide bond formation protein DsbB
MTSRLPPILLLLASAAALAAVLIAQFGFGLEPCHLCTLQRVPYAFGLLVALAASLEGRDQRQRGMLLSVCALIFATNLGLAFFHIGVEQHWWESACAEAQKLSSNAGGLLARLKAGKAEPACDSVPFQIFGISLAGLNLIFSLVLTVYAALAARRTFQQS